MRLPAHITIDTMQDDEPGRVHSPSVREKTKITVRFRCTDVMGQSPATATRAERSRRSTRETGGAGQRQIPPIRGGTCNARQAQKTKMSEKLGTKMD